MPAKRVRIVREQPRRGLSDEAFERRIEELATYLERFGLLDDAGRFARPHPQHWSQNTPSHAPIGNLLGSAIERGYVREAGPGAFEFLEAGSASRDANAIRHEPSPSQA